MRLTEVSSEVGNVRTDVASTRNDLDKTISDLRRTTGDMGVMSGLIATNQKELEALKARGERDYYEFTLTKSQKQQRIGDILMAIEAGHAARGERAPPPGRRTATGGRQGHPPRLRAIPPWTQR